MSLIEKIKQDQIEARKTKNSVAATLLTTLLGEANMVAKNAQRDVPTDSEVQEVIKKFLKGVSETLSILDKSVSADAEDRRKVVNSEKAILEGYMPKQLSENELAEVLSNARAQGTESSVKGFMAFLKSNYAGQYDGKVAKKVIDGILGA